MTAKKIDPKSKPDPDAASKDELKSVAMAELEKKLGSTPDGLTQAEVQTALLLPGIRNWKWHGTKAT